MDNLTLNVDATVPTNIVVARDERRSRAPRLEQIDGDIIQIADSVFAYHEA